MITKNAKVLKYNGVDVVFVQGNGTWLVKAKDFGKALGYSLEGRRLVASIRSWQSQKLLLTITPSPKDSIDGNVFDGDVYTATGPYYQAHRERVQAAIGYRIGILSDSVSYPKNAESGTPGWEMVLLTLQGASKVLMRANMRKARNLRDRWSEVTSALMNDTDMPEIAVGSPPKTQLAKSEKAEPQALALAQKDPLDFFKDFATALRAQERLGNIEMKDVKALVLKSAYAIVSRLEPTAITVPTQAIVPAEATDLALRGLSLLKSHSRPHKFQGWETAEELGGRFNRNERSIGHYLSVILDEEPTIGPEKEVRANIIAGNTVGTSLEKLKACIDPDTGLATVYNDDQTCVALHCQDSKGQFHWRNYWSPQFVEWVLPKLRAKYSMVKVPGPTLNRPRNTVPAVGTKIPASGEKKPKQLEFGKWGHK